MAKYIRGVSYEFAAELLSVPAARVDVDDLTEKDVQSLVGGVNPTTIDQLFEVILAYCALPYRAGVMLRANAAQLSRGFFYKTEEDKWSLCNQAPQLSIGGEDTLAGYLTAVEAVNDLLSEIYAVLDARAIVSSDSAPSIVGNWPLVKEHVEMRLDIDMADIPAPTQQQDYGDVFYQTVLRVSPLVSWPDDAENAIKAATLKAFTLVRASAMNEELAFQMAVSRAYLSGLGKFIHELPTSVIDICVLVGGTFAESDLPD